MQVDYIKNSKLNNADKWLIFLYHVTFACFQQHSSISMLSLTWASSCRLDQLWLREILTFGSDWNWPSIAWVSSTNLLVLPYLLNVFWMIDHCVVLSWHHCIGITVLSAVAMACYLYLRSEIWRMQRSHAIPLWGTPAV